MTRPLLIINDHKKVEEVYNKSEEYIKIHSNLRDEIATYLWAYHEIGDLIPQTVNNFWSGHFFPYSESYYELENSFELCKQGFYRHSLFTLRCVLELGVIGLYFDLDDQAHIDIKDWLHSKDKTPYFRDSLQQLFKLEYFKQFNDVFSLQQEVGNIYSALNDFVHVRGYQYSTTGQTQSNFNQLSDLSLRQYIEFMKKIVKVVAIMMLLKYPIGMQKLPIWGKFGLNSPAGGFLDESSQSAVLAILDEDTKKVLQNISNNDPAVIEIVTQIYAMPNMTGKQLEKQRTEWDEMHGTRRQKPDGDNV